MNRPLHVLQLVHTLHVGGTERLVVDLAGHFEDADFHTSVCCLDQLGEFGEDLRARGVAVDIMGRRPGLDVGLVRRLARFLRDRRVDVVHAHQYTPYFYAASAALLTPGVRVIFTEHGRHQPDRLRIRRALGNRLLARATGAYTAVAEFTRDSLVRYERIPRDRIRVIYNGVDLEGAAPGVERAAAKHALGLSPETPLVLSVGRLNPIKDFGTLIRAMARIVPEMMEATLLIAGDGEPAYRAELTALIAALGLEGRIRLLGTRRDVPALLAACDVFALTSVTEAASMIILEAMVAGRAVVATQVGGNGELVADSETGLLVPVGDVPAVADALARLLKDGETADAMGAAGRRRAAVRFSRPAMFAGYRQAYLDTAAR
jgi:glycosyltransferase involved in cell wall biosynthesis